MLKRSNIHNPVLKSQATTQQIPRHVAIIMDGNGRWAGQHLLPRIAGHRAGLKSVRSAVQQCAQQKIEVLTLFAFSSENWRRPPTEVNLLMDLFSKALVNEVKKLHQNNVRLRIIGDRQRFSNKLIEYIQKAEDLTSANTGLQLVIAANYGGRWDVAEAVKAIVKKIHDGILTVAQIDESLVNQYILLQDLPEPDLFIRTGGEKRVSNFLLWQLAYTELYFTDTLWPDFNEAEFQKALDSFAARQRRFGRTGEQIEQQKGA